MSGATLRCPAPAKLNLFLHVVGRRADGYHLLQSAFRLVDWCDWLEFAVRDDGVLRRVNDVPGVPEEADLVMRAARLLQQHTGCTRGADIAVDKRLPMGGGVGGGSSDAATTLMALNALWGCGLEDAELRGLGLKLGADVPFFIYGRDAFVEGVGEEFQPLELSDAWYVVVAPSVHIPTAEIFSSKELTRDTPPIKIADFAQGTTRNDLQTVAKKLYPEVDSVINWLNRFFAARMTGSGSCVFAEVPGEQEAKALAAQCPSEWRAWAVRSLKQHPLRRLMSQASMR